MQECPFIVSSPSVTQFSRAAIENSGNDRLRVKLGSSLDTKFLELGIIRCFGWIMSQISVTVHAWPGNYFKQWWSISEKAAQTEFVTMTEINLREGKSNLQVSYESIFEENSDHETVCNRKTPKQLIQILIPEVEFHRPPKANESDPKSIKKTRNAANHLVESTHYLFLSTFSLTLTILILTCS